MVGREEGTGNWGRDKRVKKIVIISVHISVCIKQTGQDGLGHVAVVTTADCSLILIVGLRDYSETYILLTMFIWVSSVRRPRTQCSVTHTILSYY